MKFSIALGIVLIIVYVGVPVKCIEDGEISVPKINSFKGSESLNVQNKRRNKIRNGKLSVSICQNLELYSPDSAAHEFFKKLEAIIITTESFSTFIPFFPKVFQLSLNKFKDVKLKNVTFNRLLYRIFRQISLYSDKCQQIEQVYTRKLNSLNPEAIYSPLIEYLPMRIMFLADSQLKPIVKRMDKVNKKLLVEFDKLHGCDQVFDKKRKQLIIDVHAIDSEIDSSCRLINIDLLKNLDAVQKTLDSLNKKTANIHEVMIARDMQENISQAAADCLDEAVKTLEEFIEELNVLLTPPQEEN